MNSTPVYPAYALVAMAREANRALVHALRVNSAPLAVNAARRRAKYMALARVARATAPCPQQACEVSRFQAGLGTACRSGRAPCVVTTRQVPETALPVEGSSADGHMPQRQQYVAVGCSSLEVARAHHAEKQRLRAEMEELAAEVQLAGAGPRQKGVVERVFFGRRWANAPATKPAHDEGNETT